MGWFFAFYFGSYFDVSFKARSDNFSSKRKRTESTVVDFKNKLDSSLLEIYRDNVLIGMKRKLYCHKTKKNSMKKDTTYDTKLTRLSVKYFSQVLDECLLITNR
uniref:Uncharacterized protein n=1 Tax=Oryza sativa subsp. japonica TaxID=39947 RepID=Q33AZ4_ORYSJ|nr:hypothetical protein LOC_Os10g06750 [Oryza sativa Japonica Group]